MLCWTSFPSCGASHAEVLEGAPKTRDIVPFYMSDHDHCIRTYYLSGNADFLEHLTRYRYLLAARAANPSAMIMGRPCTSNQSHSLWRSKGDLPNRSGSPYRECLCP